MKTNMPTFSKKVILASASPRRKDILAQMGLEYEIIPADVDEKRIRALFPQELVKKLAVAKAQAVLSRADGATVIAADTVVYRHKLYGKPLTLQKAIDTICALNGKWHTVYTGVCIACGEDKIVFYVRSRVKFRQLTRREIEDYVVQCRPLDKAGAYGIQDKQIVEKYTGSYSNIVGLPIEKLADYLGRVGVIDGNDRTFH